MTIEARDSLITMVRRIETCRELVDLGQGCEKQAAKGWEPQKCEEFYLFKGVNRCYPRLLSSLQVLFCNQSEGVISGDIIGCEQYLVNRFLKEIAGHAEFSDHYTWFDDFGDGADTFKCLSAMQHFGCPTRLCDFTLDFWTALYFAASGADGFKDMCIYRLKCKNENEQGQGGNKTPKNRNGNSWPSLDMNELVGLLIRHEPFAKQWSEKGRRLHEFIGDSEKGGMYGWDTPKRQNSRIRKQRGYFVYPFDILTPLGDTLAKDKNADFCEYRISANLLPQIQIYLDIRNLTRWKVFVDLEMAFKHYRLDRNSVASDRGSRL